jgi:uncharacterized protein (DUF2267 family)
MRQHRTEEGGRELPKDKLTRRVYARLEELAVLPEDLDPAEATEAVLCVLSSRLDEEDARDLEAHLPESLRAIVRMCPAHRAEEGEPMGDEDLVHELARHMHISIGRADSLARAVLTAIRLEIPAEELVALESRFTPDLKELWAIRRAA